MSGGNDFLRRRGYGIVLVAVHGAEDGQERRGYDVAVYADTKAGGRVTYTQLDIAGGARIGAGADGVLVVIHHLDRDIKCVHKGGDGPIAATREYTLLTVAGQ